jgi:hypothetical protein
MSFLAKLFAILAMTLPPGSVEEFESSALGSSPVSQVLWMRSQTRDVPVFRVAPVPSPRESFFERLDESALDEEDSTRAEDQAVLPLAIFDYKASLASGLITALSPAHFHSPLAVVTPMLRC